MEELNQWSLYSWKNKEIVQNVVYKDKKKYESILEKLDVLPPLVHQDEIEKLKEQLREVAENKRFLLQGGDCAELFEYCNKDNIENQLKILLKQSLILIWGGRTSVVRIGRMAGQYAKPRSSPVEIIDGKEYPSYRGDIVNGYEIDDREPNPDRLLQSYFHSSATLNYIRSLINTGFADLHKAEHWNLSHIRNQTLREEHEAIIDQLRTSLEFLNIVGIGKNSNPSLETIDFFVSHEGLLLDYESQFTKKVVDPTDSNKTEKWYNLGTHFLWIGDRTRQLNGAHVEYFRGIQNPIGIKVGPSMKPQELIDLLDIVDPNFELGKVTLITRYGFDKIEQYLPDHIKAVQSTKHRIIWCCDPMHGNTVKSSIGLKTRNFDNILGELKKAFEIHKSLNSNLNGVHFEMTGEKGVTECIGGSMQITEKDLKKNYQTNCDPRLNYEQSLDISLLIAQLLRAESNKKN
ncbi:DAHP synthetase [Piromyces finnis]|uniref:Phospho-2-dehydro-3-deoxyheptonate aldolase n=1 Tax=Piromyces finnis TaxID=1754191 RepID=A0A1Y1V8F4_9FUNG|nr:DAHP synthetase [Piromyces finnis]|eukprot:ORX48415.1 DAHP synthetase [Piromyces finnis]